MSGKNVVLYNPAYKPKPEPSSFLQPNQISELKGKSVAILDNSWWVWEKTLPTLRKALLTRYGVAKVSIYKVPRSSPATPDELKKIAEEVDCAIVGLAFGAPEIECIVEDAVALMKEGLPIVCIVVGQDPDITIWKKLMVSRNANIPFVTIPREPELLPVEEAIEMMEAIIDDLANTLKNPLMLQVEDVFNEPFLEVRDSLDEIYDIFYANGWTDGLPIIPPTQERVHKMLKYVGGNPEEVVGELPMLKGLATLGAIAANGVMAGCLPEHMPVLIAIVRASRGLGFGAIGPTMVIINGPIRKKLEINCSTGCMGPGRRSNAAIGRALQLMLRNIGGSSLFFMPDMTGHPASYTFCFGENEEESPWIPLHMERGFSRETSTVTVAGIYPASIIQSATYTYDWETIIRVLADSTTYLGNSGMLYGSGRESAGRMWVFLTPELAERLASAGLSKRKVKEHIWEKARFPVSQYPPNFVPYPHHLLVKNGEVQAMRSPEDVNVVVVASRPGRYYAMTINGGAGTTVPIT
ncbi:MAG: hypothetical protein QW222_03620 [Candidatus Bathyarchaeia archaeon]